MIRSLIITFFCMLISTPGWSETQTLDDLLQEVREGRAAEKIENEERIARFRQNKAQQSAELEKVLAELAAEEARGEILRQQYEENNQAIETQKNTLIESAGAMTELHAVIRQMARDISNVITASLVSSEKQDRRAILENLASNTEMPSPGELQTLWQTLLEEMVESGKVSRYKAKVITTNGDEVEKQVTRVGTFNATADGHYLRFLPDSGRLAEPRRQPPHRYQILASNLENSQPGELLPMVVDPTRGAMLSLMIQKPDLIERIRQGGVIGYIILVIGMIALLIALERFIVLMLTASRIRKQIRDREPSNDNPLGRIMMAYTNNPGVDAETLGLKLDEAILRELPKVKRGLRTLAILAAIAPLLGLLGTVTGIIETFQSITLFGTGDPRLMSGGISQALVTTVQGLVVAIPILLLHSILAGKSNSLVQILDEKSAAMVASLAEKQSGPV